MLSCHIRVYKAVADRENMHAITNGLPPYQHMSAMVTINASGESVPPMIILSNLQKLPQDLREFQHAAWWASSPNGWMTKRLFTCWAVNFAHWLAKYLAKINVHESMPALLFVDGHSSRINYTALEYPHQEGQAVDGVTVAQMLGQNPDQVFKTLVTQGASHNYYVFVVPVAASLDLKKAAKAVGEKSVAMLRQKELLPLTGYVHGGCSPIGMKKQYPTVFHETAEILDTIIGQVSAS